MQFNTLVEAVAYWAEATPDKTCLIEAETDRQMSYGEFWRLIRVFAKRLIEAGVQKGDRVVVRVGPLHETFVAQFGIYLAGGVYCPVEKHMKALKMLEMLEYYDSTLLISSDHIEFEGVFIALKSVCEDGEPLEEFAFPDPDDMCAIVFTTGTTGKAKGVMISYNTGFHYADMLFSIHRELPDNEAFLWTSALDRIGGVVNTGYTFKCGFSAVHCNSSIFAINLFEAVGKYQAAALSLFPESISILLETSSLLFSKYANLLRSINIGGSNMIVNNKRKLHELLPNTKLFLCYNSTEILNLSCCDLSLYGGLQNCVGKIFSGTQLSFVDDKGRPVTATAQNPGFVVVGNNKTAMLGYWKDPELTSRTLINGRIIMTDIGYIDDDGLLYLLGRKDDIIVSGGFKIAPYEIEEAAMQLHGIRECACVPVKNKVLTQIPALFVVMRDSAEFNAKEIYSGLAQRLETYKLPRIIRQLDKLPRTADGLKINRREVLSYA